MCGLNLIKIPCFNVAQFRNVGPFCLYIYGLECIHLNDLSIIRLFSKNENIQLLLSYAVVWDNSRMKILDLYTHIELNII